MDVAVHDHMLEVTALFILDVKRDKLHDETEAAITPHIVINRRLFLAFTFVTDLTIAKTIFLLTDVLLLNLLNFLALTAVQLPVLSVIIFDKSVTALTADQFFILFFAAFLSHKEFERHQSVSRVDYLFFVTLFFVQIYSEYLVFTLVNVEEDVWFTEAEHVAIDADVRRDSSTHGKTKFVKAARCGPKVYHLRLGRDTVLVDQALTRNN
jgi:hypothetical protein